MQVYVLRTCYVNDRLWAKGIIANIPDNIDLEINSKNFKPVNQAQDTDAISTQELQPVSVETQHTPEVDEVDAESVNLDTSIPINITIPENSENAAVPHSVKASGHGGNKPSKKKTVQKKK